MRKMSAMAVSATAGLSLVLSGTAAIAPALAQEGASEAGSIEESPSSTKSVSHAIELDRVVGEFTFDQMAVDSNEIIAKAIASASKVLCGANDATAELGELGDEEWSVQVGGQVKESFTLTEAELSSSEFEQHVMKCICAGNPADGRAAVNATVTGVTLRQVFERAQPEVGTNTIVFTSADGYKVELPLAYVMQRKSLIVYQINGEGLDASVGGHNQLWLGTASARYFARDIVKVDVVERETPPPAPGSAAARDVFPNSPNIAVTGGE